MPTFEMLASALGAAAVVPPLFYLWAIASLERHRKPVLSVLGTFLLGALGAFSLRIIRPPFDAVAATIDMPLLSALAQAVIGIAAPEEAPKVVALILFSRHFMSAGRPIDGVLYGAAVGLGFAAAENLWYLIYQAEEWEQHHLARNLATVPLHAGLGIIAGTYIGRAVLARAATPQVSLAYSINTYLTAWAIPTLLHGLYDFPQLLIRGELRPGPLAPSMTEATLDWLVLVAGTAVILAAARFVYRAVRAEGGSYALAAAIPRTGHHPWHLDLLGAMVGLIGALMVLIELRALLREEVFTIDRHLVVLFGTALLVVALDLHRRAARRRQGRA